MRELRAPSAALTAALSLLLLTSALAGCVEVEGPAPPPERDLDADPSVRPIDEAPRDDGKPFEGSEANRQDGRSTEDQWRDEANAKGSMGLEATLDLGVSWAHLTGEMTAPTLAAPFSFAVEPLFPEQVPLVFFPNAQVTGAGRGLLVLEGAAFQATGGRLDDLALGKASVNDAVVLTPRGDGFGPDKPNATFPDDWPAAQRGFFFADWVDASVVALALEGHDRALFVDASGARELIGAIEVTADGWFAEVGTHLRTDEIALDARRFGLAGNTTRGEIKTVDGTRSSERPTAVFGDNARLLLTPQGVASEGTLRWTQATGKEGLVLPATVDVFASKTSVEVVKDETVWVKAFVRESGYVGTASLVTIDMEGSGKHLVRVPVAAPSTLVETLWEMVEATGPLAGFFALPVGIASPFFIVLEGLVCAFGGCPWKDTYPVWQEPGAVESFNIQVVGEADPGTYEATIIFRGENHADVRVPLTITITS